MQFEDQNKKKSFKQDLPYHTGTTLQLDIKGVPGLDMPN